MSSFERRGFADQLSIETPEQVALMFPVAGIGSRFAAVALDHLIQLGIFLAIAVLLLVVVALTGHSGLTHLMGGKWLVAGIIALSFLVFWGYFSLFEAFWHGQTPGKRVLKLRVIKDSGRQITLFESLARNLLRYVDYLPGLYLAGIITMLANRRKKRLGDFAAGTLVIHEITQAQPLLWSGSTAREQSSFYPESAETAAVFPADAVAHLSQADLVLIEAFFARAMELPLDTRATMAQRILQGVCERMGVALPAGSPERSLEALARELRGQRRARSR